LVGCFCHIDKLDEHIMVILYKKNHVIEED
jgi:hypothetical protein